MQASPEQGGGKRPARRAPDPAARAAQERAARFDARMGSLREGEEACRLLDMAWSADGQQFRVCKLLEQLDALLGMQGQVRVEGTVREQGSRNSQAWVYQRR